MVRTQRSVVLAPSSQRWRTAAQTSNGSFRFRAVPTSWSPDGECLAFFDRADDVWVLPRDGEPTRLLGTPASERSARFSPDGKWLAYVSDETGEFQVYVIPFPGPGPRIPVSVDGGLSPIWSSDGKELFFRRGSKVIAA